MLQNDSHFWLCSWLDWFHANMTIPYADYDGYLKRSSPENFQFVQQYSFSESGWITKNSTDIIPGIATETKKVGKILNAKNYLLTKSKLDILAMVASVSFFCSQQCTWQPSLEFSLFYRQNCSWLTCLRGWELQRERDFTFKIVCNMKDPCKIWDTI
jgi:hypothetical protein